MDYDVIILGAGAAGLMCAAHCGGRVLVVDHARKAGEKIRISGGGRCNFTNTGTEPANFLSANPHFAKSALKRYTPWDFVSLVSEHGIDWHEKTLGQLFCDDSARQIVSLLTGMVEEAGGTLTLDTRIEGVTAQDGDGDGAFAVTLNRDTRPWTVRAPRLVVATGGKSIPKMGATGLAYDIARQFGHAIVETHPGLVPFTFPPETFSALAGLSLPVRATAGGTSFEEALLFTHRGLSGPAILQVSSYWTPGAEIEIDLLPGLDPLERLRAARQQAGRRAITTVLAEMMPARLAQAVPSLIAPDLDLDGNLADHNDASLGALCDRLTRWRVKPTGTEGYRTAEVTLGGVDTAGLSSKTMESTLHPGLHFIGECVDVTGWLGGYNFQWAWASAMACATAIRAAQQA
ncbi:BaiN/RdsA family NAD(P)/FAD-dependent oxidoreductase [Pseudooceanicola sp. 502str34]